MGEIISGMATGDPFGLSRSETLSDDEAKSRRDPLVGPKWSVTDGRMDFILFWAPT